MKIVRLRKFGDIQYLLNLYVYQVPHTYLLYTLRPGSQYDALACIALCAGRFNMTHRNAGIDLSLQQLRACTHVTYVGQYSYCEFESASRMHNATQCRPMRHIMNQA